MWFLLLPHILCTHKNCFSCGKVKINTYLKNDVILLKYSQAYVKRPPLGPLYSGRGFRWSLFGGNLMP